MNAVQEEIEIPTHCPLCHKTLGDNIYHIVLDDETVVCIHCWHLDQELTIRTMVEQTDWWLSVKLRWRCICQWRYNLKPAVRQERRNLQKAIEEINSGEVPVIKVIDSEADVEVAS